MEITNFTTHWIIHWIELAAIAVTFFVTLKFLSRLRVSFSGSESSEESSPSKWSPSDHWKSQGTNEETSPEFENEAKAYGGESVSSSQDAGDSENEDTTQLRRRQTGTSGGSHSASGSDASQKDGKKLNKVPLTRLRGGSFNNSDTAQQGGGSTQKLRDKSIKNTEDNIMDPLRQDEDTPKERVRLQNINDIEEPMERSASQQDSAEIVAALEYIEKRLSLTSSRINQGLDALDALIADLTSSDRGVSPPQSMDSKVIENIRTQLSVEDLATALREKNEQQKTSIDPVALAKILEALERKIPQKGRDKTQENEAQGSSRGPDSELEKMQTTGTPAAVERSYSSRNADPEPKHVQPQLSPASKAFSNEELIATIPKRIINNQTSDEIENANQFRQKLPAPPGDLGSLQQKVPDENLPVEDEQQGEVVAGTDEQEPEIRVPVQETEVGARENADEYGEFYPARNIAREIRDSLPPVPVPVPAPAIPQIQVGPAQEIPHFVAKSVKEPFTFSVTHRGCLIKSSYCKLHFPKEAVTTAIDITMQPVYYPEDVPIEDGIFATPFVHFNSPDKMEFKKEVGISICTSYCAAEPDKVVDVKIIRKDKDGVQEILCEAELGQDPFITFNCDRFCGLAALIAKNNLRYTKRWYYSAAYLRPEGTKNSKYIHFLIYDDMEILKEESLKLLNCKPVVIDPECFAVRYPQKLSIKIDRRDQGGIDPEQHTIPLAEFYGTKIDKKFQFGIKLSGADQNVDQLGLYYQLFSIDANRLSHPLDECKRFFVVLEGRQIEERRGCLVM